MEAVGSMEVGEGGPPGRSPSCPLELFQELLVLGALILKPDLYLWGEEGTE